MNLRKRQPHAHTVTVAADPTSATRSDRAEELRARAAAVREDIAAQERAIAERADEAGALEEQARQLELERHDVDEAVALRREAD